MGALIRAHDWASSPLGPPQAWPQGLRTALRLLLNTQHPMLIWWGPDQLQFYNDAYREVLGPERHPRALGQAARDCWPEFWDQLAPKIAQIMESVRGLEKELARFKSKHAASQGDELVGRAVEVKGIKILAATLDGADAKALRETMDKLKDKLKTAAIVLAAVSDGKVTLIAGVTADLTSKVKAGMTSWSTLKAVGQPNRRLGSTFTYCSKTGTVTVKFSGSGRVTKVVKP